jgi:O-methyltransferase domain
MSKISDLNMLAMMGGKERTGPEWRALLQGAGFTGIEYARPARPFSHPGNSAITAPTSAYQDDRDAADDLRSTALTSSYSAGRVWIVLLALLLRFRRCFRGFGLVRA